MVCDGAHVSAVYPSNVSDTRTAVEKLLSEHLNKCLSVIEVGRMINVGGTSQVFQLDLQLKEHNFHFRCVVKAVSLNHQQLAEREVAVYRKIGTHANIARFHGYFSDEKTNVLVMSSVGDVDLMDLLTHTGRPLHPSHTMKVGLCLANALHHLHSHAVLHRDVKPENVVIHGDSAFLVDMGLAVFLDDDGLYRSSSRPGTVRWQSPEILDMKPYGTHADVYSMGLVLFTAATWVILVDPEMKGISSEIDHATRFPSFSVGGDAWNSTPAELCTLIELMLSRDKLQRPTAQQVVCSYCI